MASELPVVFATDENYVPYCGVAICSLIRNIDPCRMYKIYVLYDSLSFENITKLERLSVEHASVKCICIHEYVKDVKVSDYMHITVATIFRIVIPEIFKKYEKVIYLDSDIIVRKDISFLYQTELADSYLAACKHEIRGSLPDYLKNVLNVDEDVYFNAGVLVINIKKCVDDNIYNECASILINRKDLLLMDQCALNLACKGNIKIIDDKWNYQWLKYVCCDNNHQEKETVNASASFIIHYDGDVKPWNNPDYMISDYFWECARTTSFYEQIICEMMNSKIKDYIKLTGRSHERYIIYGAGDIGKKVFRKIRMYGLGDIILWVDKNYNNINNNIFAVECVEKIYNVEFDYLIIAIGSSKIADDVRDQLIQNGISNSKIIRYF